MTTLRERIDWIEQVDHSDQNRLKLDTLNLSYPGWQQDFSSAEEIQRLVHIGDKRNWAFEDAYHSLVEKQRLYVGDRSHPSIVDLDSLILSYDGWQSDVDKAEKVHLSDSNSIPEEMLECMRRKQQVSVGDRSHSNLVKLDALFVDYNGWQQDAQTAEKEHLSGRPSWAFNDAYHRLTEKQKVYAGDRSHPSLARLDFLKLTYTDWEEDVNKAEKLHLSDVNGITEQLLESLSRKQDVFVGNRSHPNLVKLDALLVSYPGWQRDFQTAEQKHLADAGKWAFNDAYHGLVQKERLHNGDRSHPCLVALDSLSLTYPDWQSDMNTAEGLYMSEYNCASPHSDFQELLERIKKKETIYCQYRQDNSDHRSDAPQGDVSQETMLPGAEVPPDTCIICLHQMRSHAFVPCGHVCVCKACGDSTMRQSGCCPLCRQKAQQAMRLYFS